MSRCVIVGGAEIKDYNRIKALLHSDDFFIFCDCGLRHREALGVSPSLIVGDFDSAENPMEDIETIVLPCEKDDTDTIFAAKEGIRRGYEEFVVIGAVGGRLDHTLGNLSLLLFLFDAGKKATLHDDFSDMEIVGNKVSEVKDDCKYFSLLCISEKAEGIFVSGAKYPLENASISSSFPLGVSNEVIKGEVAKIRVSKGKLLLIKIFKE